MQYEIIRSARKTLAMQWLKPNTLRIRAPHRCSDLKIQRFIASSQAWINKQKQYHLENPGLPEPGYQDGEQLWLLGLPYTIRVTEGAATAIDIDDDILQVRLKTMTQPAIERQIVRWLREFAECYFSERLATCHSQAPIALPCYQFRVRQMKRQWGNCSRRGEIKLNLSLIQYPVECIDYVIWHELVHLKHFHHGAKFYHLLEQCCPDWQRLKYELESFSG